MATLLYERDKYLTHSALVPLQRIWKRRRIVIDSSLPSAHLCFTLCFIVICSYQVTSLEKKVAELENEILLNGDLKSKLKQENTQLVHRCRPPGAISPAPNISIWHATFVRYVRVHELEEQLKDQETRGEQNLLEELRRHREAFSKMERDKNTQIELLTNRWDTYKLAAIVWAGEAYWLVTEVSEPAKRRLGACPASPHSAGN